MNYQFTYQLTAAEEQQWVSFFNSLPVATIEQLPAWTAMQAGKEKHCFFRAIDNEEMVCAAVIAERKSGFIWYANIQFGPLFREIEALISSLKKIALHYRELNYTLLTVQIAMPTGAESDYLEYTLNKEEKFHVHFNRDNWSSLVLNLDMEEEKLYKDFSKGHKSDIKKAIKNGMLVKEGNADELEKFCDIFIKMNRERGISQDEGDIRLLLKNVHSFLRDKNRGFFLVVKTEEGKTVGGILIIFQGNTARYFKGTSDPEVRHLPVLHLAIWEAIKKSRYSGLKYFDLWGYNHFVNENDQVFFINRFKKGFGGNYLFYPKKMFFVFKPWTYSVYKTTRDLYNWFLKKNN